MRYYFYLTLSYLGGEGSLGWRIPPCHVFFHHPETPQAMKLKLSDFKDTFFKVPCKIGLNRKVKFLNNFVIFTDIELKVGMETNFESLNSKSNIKLEFEVIMTS